MMNNLTITINNAKVLLLNLERMQKSLDFSKEDVDLYFLMLSEIVDYYQDIQVKNEAWKHLIKQDKIQKILNNLSLRLCSLKTEWNTKSSSKETENTASMMQQMVQLEEEIRIFNEIHFKIKRNYLRFVNENYQKFTTPILLVA